LGDQEVNIVDIVSPIKKYAVMVRDPMKIGYHLKRAIYLAKNGRPGPVWLDIPLDVQAAMVEKDHLLDYDPKEDRVKTDENLIISQVAEVIQHLRQAKRPVLLVGNGVRLSGAVELLHEVVDQLNIPVLTAINGHDLIWSDHPLFFGRPGIVGDRLGNLVIQNSDFLLCIGARLGLRQISFNYEAFTRKAYRIMVDIDPAELKKNTLKIHLAIHSDARYFLEEFSKQLGLMAVMPKKEWLNWCHERKHKLPTIYADNSHNPDYINSYRFADDLFKQLGTGSVVVTGNGTAFTSTFQIMKIKKGVRVFANLGCTAMGYDLPAAIGACISLNKQPFVLITGDGSIQMNLQELQTIAYHRLPVKIFVLNNAGYLPIRITQDTYFKCRHVGSETAGGVTFPNLLKIAEAYGIPSIELCHEDQLVGEIQKILVHPGPMICQIMMDPHQTLYPKLLLW
jgi:acetolactate synthase I/II/III large subunit